MHACWAARTSPRSGPPKGLPQHAARAAARNVRLSGGRVNRCELPFRRGRALRRDIHLTTESETDWTGRVPATDLRGKNLGWARFAQRSDDARQVAAPE